MKKVQNGHLGDYKSLGHDIFEFRFFIGSGYRVYFSFVDDDIIILLVGGDKSSQSRDIKKAIQILKELKNGKSNI